MPFERARTRALLSSGLAIVAAVLLVAGVSALWGRAQVLGAEGFSRNAERALARQPVIRLVSTRIVDQVIERGSAELITIRPLLESVVTGILSTGAFRDLYAAAVADAHRTLLAHDKDTIVLGLAALCERRLPEVAFASAHNAMSAASEPGWYFASHDRGIPEQLAAGVRGFLIDSHYGVMGQGGRVRTEFAEGVNRHKLEEELGEPFVAAAKRITARWTPAGDNATRRPYLCHGFCEVGATDLVEALREFRRFLERNPHEVTVIFFEDYITPDDTATAFEESGLIDHVYTHQPGAPWPTLREMIEDDTRVLALSEKFGDAPRPAWYHAGFDVVQETPFRYHAPEEFSCRPNRGTPESPLLMMNHWIEKVTPSPADAEAVNARDVLLPRGRQCERERGMLPNLVAVNFYARGDVFAVVDALNGLEP